MLLGDRLCGAAPFDDAPFDKLRIYDRVYDRTGEIVESRSGEPRCEIGTSATLQRATAESAAAD
jgi:hypothetical protein